MKNYFITFFLVSCVTLSAAEISNVTPTVHSETGNIFGKVTKVEGIAPNAMALYHNGKNLFCGSESYVYALDIADPMSPVIIGSVKICGNVRQLVEKDGYLYVCSRETGVWIIDARNLGRLGVLARYDAVELATGIDVAGDVMILGLRQNGVEFVDVSDKNHPQHILLQKTDESQSVCYKDGVVYSGEWGGQQLSVISASDMEKEVLVKTVPLRGYGDGVIVQGNRLYVSTGHHMTGKDGMGHALEIFDISDPLDPKSVSRTQFDKFYARGNDFWTPRPNADGSVVFCADTFNGLYAVDSADASIVGHITFDTGSDKNPTAVCSSVAVGDGVVYATCKDYGLAAIKCEKAAHRIAEKGVPPVNVSYRRPYETMADSHFLCWKPEGRAMVRSVAAYGDYLYAACSWAGLYILKLNADGAEPVGRMEGFAGDVKVDGNQLFVAEGMSGLAVYDITGKGAVLKEAFRTRKFGKKCSQMCLWVWIPSDKYVVVTDRSSPYVFLDRNTFEPVFSFKPGPGWDRYTCDRVCKGGLLPVVLPGSGFAWIEMAGGKPVLYDKNKVDRPSLTSGVCNYGDGAITIIESKIVYLEPGQKADDSGNRWKGYGSGFKGAPRYDGAGKLSINYRIGKRISLVDISVPEAPELLWREETSGNPETPIFVNGKLCVPCGYQGLLIQK